jgi:hypothetical protein
MYSRLFSVQKAKLHINMKAKKPAALAANPLKAILRTLPSRARIVGAKGYSGPARQGESIAYRLDGIIYYIHFSTEGGEA